MTVYDLNKDQLIEAKQMYWIETHDSDPDYYTLANIDDIVSDDEVFDYWGNTTFTEGDFEGSYADYYAPCRIIINVNSRRDIPLALDIVREFIDGGATRGSDAYCDFEIIDR